MEYTHIHKHPCVKSKQPNKNTVQQIDQVNKGNKKLYVPVKNKTNLSTNQKTKLKQGAKWRNKAMKTKLINMLREKKRKNRYAKLSRGR